MKLNTGFTAAWLSRMFSEKYTVPVWFVPVLSPPRIGSTSATVSRNSAKRPPRPVEAS